ncbi:MAG: hypothetical protein LEGION0398_MBIBDBAK_01425 [Legionellaceae bacterium]
MIQINTPYEEIATKIVAIKNILNSGVHTNINKLEGNLTELREIKEKILKGNDPFLHEFIEKWEKEIGFTVPENLDSEYKENINKQEELLKTHFNYWKGKLQILNEQINKINPITSVPKINLRKEIEQIIKQLKEINTNKNENTLNSTKKFLEVKNKCYKLQLQCKILGITNEKLNPILEIIKTDSMENIEKNIEEIEKVLKEVNPIKQEKSILNDLKKFLFKPENKKNNANNTPMVLSKELSKSALKPKIIQLSEIVNTESELKAVIEQIHNILKEYYDKENSTIEDLLEQSDELKNLFEKAEKVKVVEELPEIGEILTSIDTYYTTIIKEEKIDEEYGENNAFSPILLKLLQYQFDLKNISLCIEGLQNLLTTSTKEEIINESPFKFIFLNTLTKLGESTKDLSRNMQNELQLPSNIFRIIRNHIFHTLVDLKVGRKEFWKFIQGNSDQLNNSLLKGCLLDLKELLVALQELEGKFKVNHAWENYPDYEKSQKKSKKR